MTNDEKAKAYEMALEAARKELGVDRKEWEVVQRVLRNIFPELKESEDERIRKELIQFLRDYPTNLPSGKYSRSDFFAWLEKQKEHVPEAFMPNMTVYPGPNIPSCSDTAISPSMQNTINEESGTRKEPKPAWSEEDEEYLKELIDFFDGVPLEHTKKAIKDWLKHCLKIRRPSWKPTQEQMNYLSAAVIDAKRRNDESTSGFPRYHALKEIYEELLKL